MHSRYRSRPFALVVAVGLVVGLAGTLTGASPALATAPPLALTPATGDYSADTGTLGVTGVTCPSGDQYFLALTSEPVTLPISVSDVNTRFVSPDATDGANTITNFGSGSVSDGSGNATFALFPDGGYSWIQPPDVYFGATVNGLVATDGDGSYTLLVACYNPAATTLTALGDSNGNAFAADLHLQLTANAADGTGTWTVNNADQTTTQVAAAPASDGGTTLTATVADATTSSTVPVGTVQFYADDSTSPLNTSPVAVNSSGAATFEASASALAAGIHQIMAKFTPTDSTAFSSSTSGDQAIVVTAPTAVALSVTATGTEVDLTATVQKADGTTATAAAGTIDFAETTGSGWTDKTISVTAGVAHASDTGLTAGSTYTFTATYKSTATEALASSPASDPQSATVPKSGQNGTLTDGGTVQPGTDYDVTFPAGTFTDSGTVDVVLHSTPQTLTPGTAAADGSLNYTFSAPNDLVAGDSHTLVFTGATDSTKTQTIAFTVAAANTGAPGNNDPSTFLTDSTAWVVSTPQGIATLVGVLVLAIGAGVGGWMWFWRRRRLAQERSA
jgi:hypothetical protein